MKVTHLALACALAVGGSAAFAQGDSGGRDVGSSQSSSHAGEKLKSGMHNLGEKTRHAWDKLTGKAHDANTTAKRDDRQEHDTRAMGAGPSRDHASGSTGSTDARQQRMDDAYAHYKSSPAPTKK